MPDILYTMPVFAAEGTNVLLNIAAILSVVSVPVSFARAIAARIKRNRALRELDEAVGEVDLLASAAPAVHPAVAHELATGISRGDQSQGVMSWLTASLLHMAWEGSGVTVARVVAPGAGVALVRSDAAPSDPIDQAALGLLFPAGARQVTPADCAAYVAEGNSASGEWGQARSAFLDAVSHESWKGDLKDKRDVHYWGCLALPACALLFTLGWVAFGPAVSVILVLLTVCPIGAIAPKADLPTVEGRRVVLREGQACAAVGQALSAGVPLRGNASAIAWAVMVAVATGRRAGSLYAVMSPGGDAGYERVRGMLAPLTRDGDCALDLFAREMERVRSSEDDTGVG